MSLSATRWQSPSPTPGAPPPPPNAKPASFARKPRVDPRLAQLQRDLVRLVRRRLPRPKTRRQRLVVALVAALAAVVAAYELSTTVQHGVIAVERCAVIAWAVTRGVMDYKALFRKTWDDSPEGQRQRHDDYEETHRRAATRLMEAMRQLGGIYIKLGQHLSTVQLVPLPWSQAMKPLQDQCFPTPLEALQDLFLAETGAPMSYFFSSFDPEPIGVASLAQVHRAVDRETGRPVAVKCMHPDIEECARFPLVSFAPALHFVHTAPHESDPPERPPRPTGSRPSTCARRRSSWVLSSASSPTLSLPGSAKRWRPTCRSRWTSVRRRLCPSLSLFVGARLTPVRRPRGGQRGAVRQGL